MDPLFGKVAPRCLKQNYIASKTDHFLVIRWISFMVFIIFRFFGFSWFSQVCDIRITTFPSLLLPLWFSCCMVILDDYGVYLVYSYTPWTTHAKTPILTLFWPFFDPFLTLFWSFSRPIFRHTGVYLRQSHVNNMTHLLTPFLTTFPEPLLRNQLKENGEITIFLGSKKWLKSDHFLTIFGRFWPFFDPFLTLFWPFLGPFLDI